MSLAGPRRVWPCPCDWCGDEQVTGPSRIPAYDHLPAGEQAICRLCWPLVAGAETTGQGPAIRTAMISARLDGKQGADVRAAGRAVLQEGGEPIPELKVC